MLIYVATSVPTVISLNFGAQVVKVLYRPGFSHLAYFLFSHQSFWSTSCLYIPPMQLLLQLSTGREAINGVLQQPDYLRHKL